MLKLCPNCKNYLQQQIKYEYGHPYTIYYCLNCGYDSYTRATRFANSTKGDEPLFTRCSNSTNYKGE